MTMIDVVLALGFVWFVLAIEWPGERDEPNDGNDRIDGIEIREIS